MSSNIDPSKVNTTYPIGGQTNPSSGFRENFSAIRENFQITKTEIDAISGEIATLDQNFQISITPVVVGEEEPSATCRSFFWWKESTQELRLWNNIDEVWRVIDDTRLSLAGGEMNGFITLHSNPVEPLHAATKGYVDAEITGVNNNLSNLAATAGQTYVEKSGDTMTGFLTLHSNPTQTLHAATKDYVDTGLNALDASANDTYVKKSGDTMTGNLNWLSTDRGLTWAMNTDGASIKFYNTGDSDPDSRLEFNTRDNGNEYFRWTHTPGASTYECMRLMPNSDGNSVLTVNGKVNAAGGTMSDFVTLHSNPTQNLHAATKQYVDAPRFDIFPNAEPSPGPRTFPVQTVRGFTAYDSSDFPGLHYGGVTITGTAGVMSGQFAYGWDTNGGGTDSPPSQLYFRTNDDTGDINNWSPWSRILTSGSNFPTQITSGQTLSSSGFTNINGSFNNNANFFDVFPPAGKTMANLLGFIPSIHVIHFAGKVDRNDSLRCIYNVLGDRIRVWVQNTEQRSTPGANWLAIWS